MLALLLSLFLAAPTTAPADGLEPLLLKMQAAGEDLTTLTARVTLDDYDFQTGANPVRPGRLALRRGQEPGDVAFHALFPAVRDGTDGPVRPEKIEYLLVGDTLVDRDYRKRVQVTRRLPPDANVGDPFKLGEGPFPLPIGQPPETVRRQFEVERYDPADAEANDLELEALPGTVRLRLVPRPDSPFARDFERIELDVDPETGFPARVTTLDPAGIKLKSAAFEDVERNADLGEAAFELEAIDLSDWNVIVEDL